MATLIMVYEYDLVWSQAWAPRYLGTSEVFIIINTRVASHLARSDATSITCVVARLSRSDTPTLL